MAASATYAMESVPNGFGHCTRWHQIAEFDKLVNQLNRYFGTEGDLPKWLSATAQACSTLPYLESALERSINQLKYGIARGACAPWTYSTRACHSTPH